MGRTSTSLSFSELFESMNTFIEALEMFNICLSESLRLPSPIESEMKFRRALIATPEAFSAPVPPRQVFVRSCRTKTRSDRYKSSAYSPFPQRPKSSDVTKSFRQKKLPTGADGADWIASPSDLPPKPPIFEFETETHNKHVWPVAGGAKFDVYRGELQNGTAVAIKCLRRPASAMSEKVMKQTVLELRAWANLKHPNLIEVLGVACFQHRLALVAPWMENGSLVDYVKRNDVDRWDMCSQVADGLACLHGHQMIHGDLKGANVLVSDDGMPKLVDFGNSCLNDWRLQFTTAESNTCSARWMAPEILNRKEDSLPHSMLADVYALGMTILEIMTGEEPYREYKKDFQVTAAVIKGIKPVRPPELGPETILGDNRWLTITSCWNQTPSSRPKASQVKDTMIVLGRF